MFRKIICALALCFTFCMWAASPALAQQKKLVYVIENASFRKVVVAGKTSIIVEFANTVPEDEVLKNTNNWRIRVVEKNGDVRNAPVADVEVIQPPGLTRITVLTVNESFDLDAQRLAVRFQFANFPEFAIGQPRKVGAAKNFAPAKGKADADIYFSGTAAGARGGKPLYSFEAKAGYFFDFKEKGVLGPRAEINAASESNIDPDSIKTALTYEKIWVFGRAKGLILRSDALGLEFDKKNRNRNFMTDLAGTLVLPPHRFGEGAFGAVDFLAGFEAGHNFRHALNENEGLGNLWRWKFGADAYFVALNPPLFKRIDFSTEYKVRLLTSAEPFTETIGGRSVTRLTKKPRHYVGSDLDFMFSDALGVTLKYRFGSQPPAFKFVDHSASVGLTFKLKQANK